MQVLSCPVEIEHEWLSRPMEMAGGHKLRGGESRGQVENQLGPASCPTLRHSDHRHWQLFWHWIAALDKAETRHTGSQLTKLCDMTSMPYIATYK